MALGAFSDAKRLFAVMACPARLAGFHILLLQGNFLHFEELGLAMAISTLETCISMGFTIENDFAGSFFIILHLLARTYGHDITCYPEKEKSSTYNNTNLFHKPSITFLFAQLTL
jgi:hypothetical protein